MYVCVCYVCLGFVQTRHGQGTSARSSVLAKKMKSSRLNAKAIHHIHMHEILVAFLHTETELQFWYFSFSFGTIRKFTILALNIAGEEPGSTSSVYSHEEKEKTSCLTFHGSHESSK